MDGTRAESDAIRSSSRKLGLPDASSCVEIQSFGFIQKIFSKISVYFSQSGRSSVVTVGVISLRVARGCPLFFEDSDDGIFLIFFSTTGVSGIVTSCSGIKLVSRGVSGVIPNGMLDDSLDGSVTAS
jgi:hypothetical protein